MCTHRGGLSAMSAGGGAAISAPAAPRISEFYQSRLSQIDAQIRHEQITASLINSDSPVVRRKAQAARKRIDRLTQQYEQIEQIARQEALSLTF